MLVNNKCSKPWIYMEIPRTASTTIEKCLRAVYPGSVALYQKHWPVSVPGVVYSNWRITSVRNPYSRAVSCWQFFTVPGEISFEDWLLQVKTEGFVEHNIEARPQDFWLSLNGWESWIRFEFLKTDLESLFATLGAVNQTVTQNIPKINAIGGPWFNRLGKSTKGLRNKPWHAFYSENTIQLVRDVYAVDFEKMRCTYSDKIEDAIKSEDK